MFKPVAQISDQQYPHWMTRLFLGGLLVLASLSLVMQLPAVEGPGFRHDHGSVVLATTAGSGPYVLAKSSQTVPFVRKQNSKTGGSDDTPDIWITGDYSGGGQRGQSSLRLFHTGYIAAHILFRSGSRAISPRAPPAHFSA